MLSFWSPFSPWNLEWMYLLYFHSTLLAYCSALFVLGLSLGSWVFFYVFGLCFHNIYGSKKILSQQTDGLLSRSVWKAVIEDGILSKSALRSKLFFFFFCFFFFQNFKNLRFLHMLFSRQGFDAGLPPYFWCAIFLSIEAGRHTLPQ